MQVSEGVEAGARKTELVRGKEFEEVSEFVFAARVYHGQKPDPRCARKSLAIALRSGLALTLDSWDNHAKSLNPQSLSWQRV